MDGLTAGALPLFPDSAAVEDGELTLGGIRAAATASNPGPPNASMRLISGDQRGRTRRGGFGICRIAIISTTSCATPATETEAESHRPSRSAGASLACRARRTATRMPFTRTGAAGRHRHAALGVQQCTGYGSQSRRRDERKHQPRVVGGEPETQGIVDIAGRQCQHEHRGDDFGQCHDDEQPERQRGECFSGQDPCRIIALLGPNAVLDRDDAAVQNPSPSTRRVRPGRRKATTNASAAGPVPRIVASRTSRTKPSTRDDAAAALTTRVERASVFRDIA